MMMMEGRETKKQGGKEGKKRGNETEKECEEERIGLGWVCSFLKKRGFVWT